MQAVNLEASIDSLPFRGAMNATIIRTSFGAFFLYKFLGKECERMSAISTSIQIDDRM